MQNKNRRFAVVDFFLILMMVLPLVLGMVLKVLLTPAKDGINVTGALVYFKIPMPIQDLPITESQVNSWLILISIFGLCLYLTHGLKKKAETKRQLLAEWIVEKINALVKDNMGEFFMGFAPFIASIFAIFDSTSENC